MLTNLKKLTCLSLTLIALITGGFVNVSASNNQTKKTNYAQRVKYRITSSWDQNKPSYNQILTGTHRIYDLPGLLPGSDSVASLAKVKRIAKRRIRLMAFQGAIVNSKYYYYRIKSRDNRIKGWISGTGLKNAGVRRTRNKRTDKQATVRIQRSRKKAPTGSPKQVTREIKSGREYNVMAERLIKIAKDKGANWSSANQIMKLADQFHQRAKAEYRAANRHDRRVTDKRHFKLSHRLVRRIDNDVKSAKIYSGLANSKRSRIKIINQILDRIIRTNNSEYK